MYARFVHLRAREDAVAEFRKAYSEQVVPVLEAQAGCLFVGLLRRAEHEDEYQSLTLWRSKEDAEAYEESGVYHRLLRVVEPYLSARTEWRVRLSDDPDATGDLSQREVPPETYEVEAAQDWGLEDTRLQSQFVRIVSMRVAADSKDRFRELYTDKIIPALHDTKGCRGVFLVEGADHPDDFLSITVWDREADAVRYEMSGKFDHLARQIEDTFARTYQWNMALGGQGGASDLDVQGYRIVAGRRLGSTGED